MAADRLRQVGYQMHKSQSLGMTLALALAACSDDGGTVTTAATQPDTTGALTTTMTAGDGSTGGQTPTEAGSVGSTVSTGDGTTGDGTTTDEGTTGGVLPATVPLSPTDHLLRASMALRGVRPSLADLDAVAADPGALPGIVDTYLEDPRFAETVKDLYAEALLLRAQLNPSMLAYRGPLVDLDDAAYLASTPEEPLKLIEWVVQDPKRSFAEIVTTDVVLVDEVGAAAWKVSGYDPKLGGWQAVKWGDERPEGGGVLASSALWHRHASNGNNYHRSRANVVSRVFLCDDYLTRDVPAFTDVDFSDPEAVKMALRSDPGCVSCHQTLDPLAGYFWGVASRGRAATNNSYDMANKCLPGKEATCFPLVEYDPAQEDKWEQRTGRAPGYFGTPMPEGGVDQLGAAVAADPRFSLCTARRFYSYMAQVQLDAVPFALVDRFNSALQVEGKLDVRALARAIVLSDEFRASHAEDGADADAVVGYKLARPEQLERMFMDLTGFRWIGMRTQGDVNGEFPLLNSDGWGYRAMAGGVDGYSVTQPTWTFNPTRTLVLQALAAEAAAYVVDRDFDQPMKTKRKLLTGVGEAAGEPAVRAQIALLHARVLGEVVADDSPEVDESFALWSAITGGSRQQWKILLTAMFQDHRMAFY